MSLVSIIILVLSMVNLHALTQDEAINSFLKDRDLEPIEGIWLTDKGTVSVIYKQGSSYIQKIIRSGSGLSYSGQHVSTFQHVKVFFNMCCACYNSFYCVDLCVCVCVLSVLRLFKSFGWLMYIS